MLSSTQTFHVDAGCSKFLYLNRDQLCHYIFVRRDSRHFVGADAGELQT